MLKYSRQPHQAFSVIELMVVISIIAILAVVAIPSYRSYTVKASIASLLPVADKAKNEIEDAHNQGVVFGNNAGPDYIPSSAPNKPEGLISMGLEAYGCVTLELDAGALGLDENQTIVLMYCPEVVDGSIEWQCGYHSSTYAGYVQYLPTNCQVPLASIQDTNF